MRAPACLLMTLTVVAAAPQPTPTPPPSSSSSPLPLHRDTQPSPFTNCIELDILEIEELRSKLHNTIDFDLTGKKENTSFGLLEEDWYRLKLLEERLPVNSLLKPKLLKLFRLMISALFQAHKSPIKDNKTNHKLYENKKLDQTDPNPPNISINLLKPTTVNQTNVLSITTVTTTIIDDVDNVAAESEQQESVLPFNTFASSSENETTTTLPSKNIDFTSNLNKDVDHDNRFPQLPDDLLPNNHSAEVDDINFEFTTNYIKKQHSTPHYSVITEVYQDLKTNYEKEHDALSAETKGDTNNKIEEPKEVEFVEKYDGTIKPIKDAVSGIQTTIVYSANEETTSPTSLETESSKFTEIDGRVNEKSTVVDETTGISKEATINSITSDATTKGDGSYNQSSLNTRSTSDQSSPSSFIIFMPETNKNAIEVVEKDHGTTYDETESREGVSEDIYSTVNSSLSTKYAQQSSGTSLSRDFTLFQPSPSQDDISKHQHIYNTTDSYSSTGPYTEKDSDYFDQPRNTVSSSELPKYYLTSTIHNPIDYKDITNEIYTDRPSPADLTSTTSENNSRHDKSVHSTTLSPFSSTQLMKTSLSKTSNETFSSFNVIFPKYPKLTSPTTDVNKLIIYPLDSSQRVIFPFERPKGPPMVQAGCQNKNTCVRVQNIEFNNPQNYGRYSRPNSEISSEDIRFHNMDAETNRKGWDSDSILWWHKIRTLRKKAVER